MGAGPLQAAALAASALQVGASASVMPPSATKVSGSLERASHRTPGQRAADAVTPQPFTAPAAAGHHHTSQSAPQPKAAHPIAPQPATTKPASPQPAPIQAAATQPATARSTSPDNRLSDIQALIGTYYGMRHGASIPSSQQRVCSSMAAGIDPRNGLTELGRQEVQRSSEAWLQANAAAIDLALRRGQLLILSSPFSRSRESAEMLAATIETWWQASPGSGVSGSGVSGSSVSGNSGPGSSGPGSSGPGSSGFASSSPVRRPPIRIEPDLRERDFGSFEGQSPSGPIYRRVWDQDVLDPHGQPWGVESAAAVQRRATALIQRLERQSQGHPERIVVLVSHGDTLKILQTGFQKQIPSTHQNPAQVKPFRTAEIRGFQLR